MTYQIYKEKLNKVDFFNRWKDEEYSQLTEELQERIYNKYLIKCEVLIRDDFKCQNENCKFCKNEQYHTKLTMHHVKFQKNGGKDSARNAVTLCLTSHKGFHRAKYEIKFPDVKYLPVHISGHTFKLSKSNEINWKKIRAEMKIFRKTLKQERVSISFEQLRLLLKFLEFEFNCNDD